MGKAGWGGRRPPPRTVPPWGGSILAPAVWAPGGLDSVMWSQGRCKTSFCAPASLRPLETGPAKSPWPETAFSTLAVSRPSPGPRAIFEMPVLASWGSSLAPTTKQGHVDAPPVLTRSPELRLAGKQTAALRSPAPLVLGRAFQTETRAEAAGPAHGRAARGERSAWGARACPHL